jgi:hypothetical protein
VRHLSFTVALIALEPIMRVHTRPVSAIAASALFASAISGAAAARVPDQVSAPAPDVRLTITSSRGTWTVPSDRGETMYPTGARDLRKNGSAYLACNPIRGCVLAHEDGDYGFGRAALDLMSRLALKVDGEVRVRFELLDPSGAVTDDGAPWRRPITEAADDPQKP